MFQWLCVVVITLIPYLGYSHETSHKKELSKPLRVDDETLGHINFTDYPDIVNFVRQFPFNEYDVYCVNKSNYFYIDTTADTIKRFLSRGIAWEPNIRDLILKHTKPGTVAIDVGAHIGIHTITMSRAVGPKGHVIAFEPQPKIFRELFMNMYINKCLNVFFYHCGASDKNDFVALHPLHPSNEGGTSLLPLISEKKQGVSLIPIDSLLLKNVSLIKIDVEGMQDLVIFGALQTIISNKPVIIFEVLGKKENPHVKKNLNYVESLGYSVTEISPTNYLALPL